VPQDKKAIKELVESTKADLKINYDIEFEAIEEQFVQSELWDEKA